jgi:hypothetical protein
VLKVYDITVIKYGVEFEVDDSEILTLYIENINSLSNAIDKLMSSHGGLPNISGTNTPNNANASSGGSLVINNYNITWDLMNLSGFSANTNWTYNYNISSEWLTPPMGHFTPATTNPGGAISYIGSNNENYNNGIVTINFTRNTTNSIGGVMIVEGLK